jgi:hypothetical protein
MFPREGKNRVGTAVALAAVLVMVLAAPAGAAGWAGWGEAREVTGGLLPRVLGWLGLAPQPGTVLKCDGDQGPHIDPNGCPKAAPKPVLMCDQGSSIDPNGCPKAGVHKLSTRTEDSLSRGWF